MNCLSAVDDLGNSFSVSATGEAIVERGRDLLGKLNAVEISLVDELTTFNIS